MLADPGLHATIRTQLGLPEGPIPGDLALTVDTVANTGVGFVDLAGLECFPNIEFLRLGAGTISDLSPLAGMNKLWLLDLTDHEIVDLSPLAGLPELANLQLGDNQIVDLSPLASLPKLEKLSVSDNPIVTFTPLAGLALVGLWANRTKPQNLDGLDGLALLTSLQLMSAGITDAGPLAGAKALASLDLTDNALVDLAPLAGHPQLEQLILTTNLIENVVPLTDLPALKQLDLDDNAIVDPDPLATLPALERLNLRENPLKADLTALLALEQLSHIDLSQTGRTALPALAPQTLSGLRAAGNAISDLSPLAGHTGLSQIDLSDNDITTLQPVLAAPFWDLSCVDLDIRMNPLAPDTLASQLPVLCDLQSHNITWDQDSCAWCLMP